MGMKEKNADAKLPADVARPGLFGDSLLRRTSGIAVEPAGHPDNLLQHRFCPGDLSIAARALPAALSSVELKLLTPLFTRLPAGTFCMEAMADALPRRERPFVRHVFRNLLATYLARTKSDGTFGAFMNINQAACRCCCHWQNPVVPFTITKGCYIPHLAPVL